MVKKCSKIVFKFLHTKVTMNLGDHWSTIFVSYDVPLCARSAAVCGGLTQQRLWEVDCDRSIGWSDAGERAHRHVGRSQRRQIFGGLILKIADACWALLLVSVNHGKATNSFKTFQIYCFLRTFLVKILWNSRLIVPSPIYGCPIKVPPPQPHLLRGLGQRAAAGCGCATNTDEARFGRCLFQMASWFPLNMWSWIDFSLKNISDCRLDCWKHVNNRFWYLMLFHMHFVFSCKKSVQLGHTSQSGIRLALRSS